MRAPDGTTWLPVADSADRHGVRVRTVYEWCRRTVRREPKVRSHKFSGRIWVCDDDVADAELRARTAGY